VTEERDLYAVVITRHDGETRIIDDEDCPGSVLALPLEEALGCLGAAADGIAEALRQLGWDEDESKGRYSEDGRLATFLDGSKAAIVDITEVARRATKH